MWQVVNVQPASEGGLVRSTGVADSGGARERGLSTDFDQEVAELAGAKAALLSGPAEIGA